MKRELMQTKEASTLTPSPILARKPKRIILTSNAPPKPKPEKAPYEYKNPKYVRLAPLGFMRWAVLNSKLQRSKFRFETPLKDTWTAQVYALLDPRDNRIRYIGKTSQTLQERLAQHLEKPTNPLMAEWLNALKTNGMQPTIRLISWAPPKWMKAERYWIEWVSKMACLLNKDAGGIVRDKFGQHTVYGLKAQDKYQHVVKKCKRKFRKKALSVHRQNVLKCIPMYPCYRILPDGSRIEIMSVLPRTGPTPAEASQPSGATPKVLGRR